MSAFSSEQQCRFSTDSAGSADNQDDLAAELRFGRHALQLGLFQRPIFDAERLVSRECNVIVEMRELFRLLRSSRLRQRMLRVGVFRRTVLKGIRAGHHTNGIGEELCCDSCFLLILAESKKADAGNNDNGGVGVT